MDSSSKPSDDQQIDPQHREQPKSGDATPDPAPAQAAEPDSVPRYRAKKTIMDLARYRLGQRVYWIVFRSERDPEFQQPAEYMRGEHPWILWRYRMMPWTVPMKPPRVHPADTMTIMMLCNEKPRVEPFRITDIVRSGNSGTFHYTGPNGMIMPEGLLFPTKKAARREIARMAKMFAAWTGTWQEGAVEGPPKKE